MDSPQPKHVARYFLRAILVWFTWYGMLLCHCQACVQQALIDQNRNQWSETRLIAWTMVFLETYREGQKRRRVIRRSMRLMNEKEKDQSSRKT
jgi:hypothetical protein